VELAVADGHEVTVFHRGRTNPDLLQGRIEHLLGDRDTGDYTALEGAGSWDATVDVTALVPRQVDQLVDAVQGRIGHYVQVSSVSAYDPTRATIDEDSPLHADPPDSTEIVDSKSYGPLKAACERVAVSRLGESVTSIVRPAYVCGPHDNEESFTYWARRMADGGAVVIRDASAPMQIIDVRDLGAFLLTCAVNRVAGAFDGVGPYAPTGELLAEITPRGVEAQLIEIDAATLAASGITLPMMSDDPNDAVISSRPGTQARRAGLTTRSAADTADATRAWDDARGRPPLQVGPSREQEAAVAAMR
jgi:2'-hydroxyisoflavone reductase